MWERDTASTTNVGKHHTAQYSDCQQILFVCLSDSFALLIIAFMLCMRRMSFGPVVYKPVENGAGTDIWFR